MYGGYVDDGLEEACKCIISIVVGDDIVPRASIHSAKDLRDDNGFIMNQTTLNGCLLFRKVKWPTIFRFFFKFTLASIINIKSVSRLSSGHSSINIFNYSMYGGYSVTRYS